MIGDAAVSEVALVAIDGSEQPSLTVVGLFGAVDPEAVVGSAVPGTDALAQLVRDAARERATVAASTDVVTTVFEDDREGVVLVSPVLDDDDAVAGAVVARLLVSELVSGNDSEVQVAIEVWLDGTPVAASPVHDAAQAPFGTPFTFGTDATSWEIVATDGGLETTHRGSWIALGAGVLFAVLAGVLASIVRASAVTAGRLQRIEHDARHDDLTGLVNRTGLTDELETRLADRRTNNLVGVLLLDLDRLKVVNDSIGHSAGDEVLNAVADRLRAAVREEDTVGRFGGDEFVVVSSGVPAIKDLTSLADRILESLPRAGGAERRVVADDQCVDRYRLCRERRRQLREPAA